jgi:hypothetical protein
MLIGRSGSHRSCPADGYMRETAMRMAEVPMPLSRLNKKFARSTASFRALLKKPHFFSNKYQATIKV